MTVHHRSALASAALAATALALLLTASGCTAAPPAPAPTVTVTVSPTAAPSPSPTATSAPAPDPSAYDPADPGTWTIDYSGIGPLVVGDTLASVQAAVPAAPETCRAGVDVYTLDGLAFTAVSGIDEADPSAPVSVVRLLSTSSDTPAVQPRTEAGIGLGSTVAELQAAYIELEPYQGMRGETVYRIAADGRTINFEDLGTGTVQIISVVAGVGVGSEYCGA